VSLFFFLFGALLLDSGVHGSAVATFGQLKTDVSSFLAFGLVILILGGLGESEKLRPVAKGMLVLVFVVFFLRNGKSMIGNLRAFSTASGGVANAPTTAPVQDSTAAPASSGSGSSSSNNDSQYLSLASNALDAYMASGV
jgi:hypothetical protein